MSNTAFERAMLRDVVAEARKVGAVISDGWVHATKMGCGASTHYEFHYQGKCYWHGRAENAYDARAKGWEAWLEQQDTER